MFTGLIVETGSVAGLSPKRPGAALTVKAGAVARDAGLGDSIAVSGVCLTVTALQGGAMVFDLSDETLRSTTLGSLRPGDIVNLEPALRPDGRLGGHFVTGHVDGVGRVLSMTPEADTIRIGLEAPPEITDYLVAKGSVAIDGISLTVVEAAKDRFSVVIIPHTARVTTIGRKHAGAFVNLEADILGKYVARFLARGRQEDSASDGRLLGVLTKAGYL